MQDQQPKITISVRTPPLLPTPARCGSVAKARASAPCAKHDLYAPLSRRPHSAAPVCSLLLAAAWAHSPSILRLRDNQDMTGTARYGPPNAC